jgi:tripartite-type tricarboxylate transporter receptor subunit TctC
MAPAQEYPKGPVRTIVPFPPGNVTDLATRISGAQLPPALGKPFVVEKLTKDAGIEPE